MMDDNDADDDDDDVVDDDDDDDYGFQAAHQIFPKLFAQLIFLQNIFHFLYIFF